MFFFMDLPTALALYHSYSFKKDKKMFDFLLPRAIIVSLCGEYFQYYLIIFILDNCYSAINGGNEHCCGKKCPKSSLKLFEVQQT